MFNGQNTLGAVYPHLSPYVYILYYHSCSKPLENHSGQAKCCNIPLPYPSTFAPHSVVGVQDLPAWYEVRLSLQ
ncbi:hypothetical protein BDZ94DRAFT_1272544 [Collybia nuda]|uniref:Uncharacterized protein n=1 Tax=Collybia nuda TaxID=64659 RepID=A0A9P6CE84_9AGAR|nr:hypothetical protein BDZ94DRAFT_1272544 [Collybia nuda]